MSTTEKNGEPLTAHKDARLPAGTPQQEFALRRKTTRLLGDLRVAPKRGGFDMLNIENYTVEEAIVEVLREVSAEHGWKLGGGGRHSYHSISCLENGVTAPFVIACIIGGAAEIIPSDALPVFLDALASALETARVADYDKKGSVFYLQNPFEC